MSTSITQPPSSHVLSLSPRTAHRSISTRVLGLTSLLFGLSFVCRQQEIPSIYRNKMYHKRVRLGAMSFLAPIQHQTNTEAITSYCKIMLGRVRLSLSVRSCLLLQRYIRVLDSPSGVTLHILICKVERSLSVLWCKTAVGIYVPLGSQCRKIRSCKVLENN